MSRKIGRKIELEPNGAAQAIIIFLREHGFLGA
jgi:hypothetical protein